MSELVHYEVHDRVAVLTIDHPPVNALAEAVWTAIDHAVARAGGDPAAEAIVLIGAGTTFVETVTDSTSNGVKRFYRVQAQ